MNVKEETMTAINMVFVITRSDPILVTASLDM